MAFSPDDSAGPWDQKWWVLLSVGIGTFMSALDGSVVNTILPVIREHFASGLDIVQWVVTIYLLVVSGVLLSFGRLGDMYGPKRVYVSGFGLFVVASALCATAPSIGLLIVLRGMQALGAAMLFASSPAILTTHFPARQRGQAMGLQAMMTYLGLACGPTLGGWLTEHFGWQSVFWVNVPVGSLALSAGLYFIPSSQRSAQVEPFDVRGASIFLAGLVSLLLALNQGHAWGWTSPSIGSLLLAAGALLGAFLWIERKTRYPMLDLELFSHREFSATVVAAVFNYVSVSIVVFLMPFYLIQGRGLSPAHAGMVLSAQPLMMAVAAPISGTISDRLGSSRLPATLGMAILALGGWLLGRLGAESPMSQAVIGLVTIGLGTGIFISPNNSALMGSAPKHRQGIASGILATARNLGMVLGVGLAGAVLTTILTSRSPDGLVEAIRAGFHLSAAVALVGAAPCMVRGSTPEGDRSPT